MKSRLTFVNTGLLILVTMVTSLNAKAFTTYTAITSGNFTADSVWSGGVAPATNFTTDDHIVIPATITVTLDHDLTLNSPNASFEIYGTLDGSAAFTAMNGQVLGDGAISAGSIRFGVSSTVYYSGVIAARNMSIDGSVIFHSAITVADTLALGSGPVIINNGASVTLGSHGMLILGAAGYNVTGGQIGATDDISVMYISPGTTGAELSLPYVRNIWVALPEDTDQMILADDLLMPGAIHVSMGQLDLNGKNVTVRAVQTMYWDGLIKGNANSNVSLSGMGQSYLAFTPGDEILSSLTIDVPDSATVQLNSDLTLDNGLHLNSGVLTIAGNDLTLNGPVTGTGAFMTHESTRLSINGTGFMGLLRWVTDSVSLGNLDLNITGPNNRVALASTVRINGVLTMTEGNLDLNGHNFTMSGIFAPGNHGALMGHPNSNVTISGQGGDMGMMVFATGYNTVKDLTFSSTAQDAWVNLGSNLNVNGRLSLYGGYMNMDSVFSLRVWGTDSVSGGSASSYIATSGTGMVWIKTDNQASANARTIPVGTKTRFAPIRISNFGQNPASYGANAHAGIWADGTTGADLSATASSISTSWNVESDAVSGNNVTIEAYWNQNMEVNQFNNHKTYIGHYTNGAWDTYTDAPSVSQANGFSSVARTGITSFSPFAVFSNPEDTTATGVKEVAATNVSVHPNPAINNIMVTVSDPTVYNAMKVFDITGQQVANYPLTRTSNSIDISPLESGVYIVSVNDKFTQRLIKQ